MTWEDEARMLHAREIDRMVGPFLRIEAAPYEGAIRFWYGPNNWVDVDETTFRKALATPPFLVRPSGFPIFDRAEILE